MRHIPQPNRLWPLYGSQRPKRFLPAERQPNALYGQPHKLAVLHILPTLNYQPSHCVMRRTRPSRLPQHLSDEPADLAAPGYVLNARALGPNGGKGVIGIELTDYRAEVANISCDLCQSGAERFSFIHQLSATILGRIEHNRSSDCTRLWEQSFHLN